MGRRAWLSSNCFVEIVSRRPQLLKPVATTGTLAALPLALETTHLAVAKLRFTAHPYIEPICEQRLHSNPCRR